MLMFNSVCKIELGTDMLTFLTTRSNFWYLLLQLAKQVADKDRMRIMILGKAFNLVDNYVSMNHNIVKAGICM